MNRPTGDLVSIVAADRLSGSLRGAMCGYGVFSQNRWGWAAIAVGLAGGARVISAAALIMIAVFGSFILNGDPTVKQFGVGLAVGVALAALTVLAFAPAILVLVGKRGTWWVPHWAERVVPHIDIEGATLDRTDGAGPKAPERPRRDSMKL